MTKQTGTLTASIGVGKSALRVYNHKDGGRVYMNNEQEFEIFLQNTTPDNHLAKIHVNGKQVSNTGLIIRPGQSFWLDCNWDDKRKFKFITYEVDGDSEEVRQAIAENGDVRIEFFKEQEPVQPIIHNGTLDINKPWWEQNPSWPGLDIQYGGVTGQAPNANPGYTTCNMDSLNFSSCDFKSRSLSKVETGRVEKGGKSNQSFKSVDMDFEFWPAQTFNFKIMPVSQKPVEKKDLVPKCGTCGHKGKMGDRFCAKCGTRFAD